MSLSLFFLAGLAAIAFGWLSRQRLASKPWLEEGIVDDAGAPSPPTAKIGLGVLLAVLGFLFALLFSAYAMRMNMAHMSIADWRPPPTPKLLGLNTAMLILSSSALQWARSAAQRGEMEAVRAGLLIGGLFAIAFVAGQLVVWRQLSASGYFLATNPANAFFYLITGAHGLHVLGGLIALGRTGAKAWRERDAERVRLSVDLCAIYWHFLLLVWLAFFALLLLT
jgi:cytochrome c oxidase subunit 3